MYREKAHSVRCAKAIRVLAELLKGQVSGDSLAAWETLLSPYPIDIVEQAAVLAARTMNFFPVPMELIELCEQERCRRLERARRAKTNIDSLLPSGTSERNLEAHREGVAGLLAQVNTTAATRSAPMMRLVKPAEPTPEERKAHEKRVREQAEAMKRGEL